MSLFRSDNAVDPEEKRPANIRRRQYSLPDETSLILQNKLFPPTTNSGPTVICTFTVYSVFDREASS
jgi:hypothetical protein